MIEILANVTKKKNTRKRYCNSYCNILLNIRIKQRSKSTIHILYIYMLI